MTSASGLLGEAATRYRGERELRYIIKHVPEKHKLLGEGMAHTTSE